MRRGLVASLFVAAVLVRAPARADTKLADQGQPIKTSRYTIDLYEGPVLATARIMGLAGAYVPISQGVEGYAVNPASVAQRVPWSTDWFDWEADAGLTLPTTIRNVDFDNNGDDRFFNSRAYFVMVGGGFQLGPFGLGLRLDLGEYTAESRDSDEAIKVVVLTPLFVVGWSLFRGELVVGAGVGLPTVTIQRTNGDEIAKVTGVSGHLGALWQPAYLPIRVGASVRGSPQQSFDKATKPSGVEVVEDDEGNFISRGYYLPRTIALPSEVNVGVALQLFRPLNFPWNDPKLEKDNEEKRASVDNARRREAWNMRRRERQEEARAEGGGKLAAFERDIEREDELLEDDEERRLDAARVKDDRRRRKSYLEAPRERLLVSAALKMTMITTDGVGLESFLEQKVARSGEDVGFSPRLGVEGEVIPRWLVLRGGSYYEPTRFREPAGPRIHGTGGFDIHIPVEWSIFGLLDDDTTFRIGGAVDGAQRYFGWGVSAGIWR